MRSRSAAWPRPFRKSAEAFSSAGRCRADPYASCSPLLCHLLHRPPRWYAPDGPVALCDGAAGGPGSSASSWAPSLSGLTGVHRDEPCGPWQRPYGGCRGPAVVDLHVGGSESIASGRAPSPGMLCVGLGLLESHCDRLHLPDTATAVLIGSDRACSGCALFMRVGGRRLHESSGCGAGLVGKVEAASPEEIPGVRRRSPTMWATMSASCAGMAGQPVQVVRRSPSSLR